MGFNNLQTKKENGIGWVIIHRPDKLNALNNETIGELKTAFSDFIKDADVKVVILTGSGERAFIAGADIRELSELGEAEGRAYVLQGQEVTQFIENFPKPVIAAVNGFALGGGTEFALACHVRYASDNAKMGQPEVKLGLIPGFGGTQRLSRLVGKGMALELILSGRVIDSAEALRIGLVNKVVPQSELISACEGLALEMMTNSPVAMRLSIAAVTKGLDKTLSEGLAHEADLFGRACASEDSKEGTQAFLGKRKAEFSGK